MRIFLALVLSLSLSLLSGAHRPVTLETVDLSLYAMPDGSLPQLCLDQDHAPSAHCPACHLHADIVMPVAYLGWTVAPRRYHPAPTATRLVVSQRPAPHQARAPPMSHAV